ncbi:MAG: AglZ/HisF2 family acetamidino modification protein [Pseudomonadota bacterium]
MIEPRFIPTLLLADHSLVKTVQFKKPNYVGDPINIVNIFSTLEADEVLVLDIEAATQRRGPDFTLLRQIANEAQVPFGYGGGIGSIEDVRAILAVGAEKVVLNTAAIEHPELITAAADLAGSQAIVASVDVVTRGGKQRVTARSGTVVTDIDPVTHALRMQELGAGEILLMSIDREGTFSGYDLDLIRKVSSAVTIPVIACGGAGTRDDLHRAIKEGGASASAAGSIFVYQKSNRSVVVNYPTQDELKGGFHAR